jgi:hypothetical protein
MGILNAIFAPFIVVYLLMYSFFRYFEVRVFSCRRWVILTPNAGVVQEPVCDQRTRIHALRQLEVPRIQRITTPLRTTSQGIIPYRKYVHGPVSQRKASNHHEVSSCY